MGKGRKRPREAGGTTPLASSPRAQAFDWSTVPDILIPDATLVAEHDRTGRDGDRPAGNEKGMLDHCIGALRRAWGLPTVRTMERPGQKVIDEHDGDRGSTPNKRALARLWDLATDWWNPAARARMIDFLVKQRTTQGHQFAEGNSSTHGQLWLGWGAILYALALHYGDAEILALAAEWWRCQAALDDAFIDPDGHRTAPNGRSAGASYDLGTVSAHMISDTAPPEYSLILGARGQERQLIAPARKDYPGFFADPYNVGAAVLGVLKHRGDSLGGAFNGERAAVRMRWETRIWRKGNQSFKVVPFAESSEFLFGCAQLDRKPEGWIEKSPGRYETPHVGGRFPQGKVNPWPVPVLEGAELTVIPGVP